MAAIGKVGSSKTLTNAQFDRVLGLFRLLADPTVGSVVAFDDDEAGVRRRYLWVIRQAAMGYWRRIANDRFGHADLDRLATEQLRQLSMTVRSRLKEGAVA